MLCINCVHFTSCLAIAINKISPFVIETIICQAMEIVDTIDQTLLDSKIPIIGKVHDWVNYMSSYWTVITNKLI